MSSRSDLKKSFAQLRKKGYIAKMNFNCCNTCAWAEIGDNYPDVDKVVFYHKQGGNDLKNTGRVYLSWCGDGKEICEVFKNNGIKVVWNGSESNTILLEDIR